MSQLTIFLIFIFLQSCGAQQEQKVNLASCETPVSLQAINWSNCRFLNNVVELSAVARSHSTFDIY